MIRGTAELYERFPWMKDYPNMSLYAIKYGVDDLIPIPWVAKDTESAEKMYKTCIEKNKDWRALYNVAKEEGVIQ